jgi:DNA-binding MarR family transcriptional regulator
MADPLKRAVTDVQMLKLMKAFELLRLMDREIPGQLVSCFFYICSHDNCHKLAMEEDLGLRTASASRVTDWLSDYHRLGKPGLGLIEKYTDPACRRRQYLRLTEKGKSLRNQIEDIVYV